jgi:catechol 2,3-dioxygenase-like lactoylglutathione lyase family enzyme
MPLTTAKVIPVLRMFDVDKAKEFYVDYLGFKVDWEHRFEAHFPLYMQVSLGELVLHLSEHAGDGFPGYAVFVRVTGLEAYHEELAAKKYKDLTPRIEPTPWNSKCINLIDPFGNKIRFNEYLAKSE